MNVHLERTFVYRFFDEDNKLLYVGITKNLHNRFYDHSSKNWWVDVSRTHVEECPNRTIALIVEATAIIQEKPIHNKHIVGEKEYSKLLFRDSEISRSHGISSYILKLKSEVDSLRNYLFSLGSQHTTIEELRSEIEYLRRQIFEYRENSSKSSVKEQERVIKNLESELIRKNRVFSVSPDGQSIEMAINHIIYKNSVFVENNGKDISDRIIESEMVRSLCNSIDQFSKNYI